MRAFRLQSLRGLRQVQSRFPRQSSWVCPGCRVYQSQHRWSSDNSSDKSKEKPYYITTPIFYVNAAPHIGHLYTMVLADVLKRWQQINGKEALLCTGTDEHGMKIQQAAAKEGMPPKEFCDNNASKFKDLAEVANISYDFFIRTTDEDHKSVVEQFWLLLKTRAPEGLGLYKGQHEGWYCVSDECFYPEDLVQPSVVPQTGRKIMASIETGNEVEWVTEDTWFFPLSKYKEKLLKFYDENPDWIQPAHRMNEVRNWVEHHLEDLSITRPASRLSWGIKDPEDPSNTIYVWVDALINYITKAGFGSKWQVDSADKGIWPADVQVVGKDIIRFHAVYWPALLMAVGLPLPKKIVCHNHWTMSNRKMSKSLGNVVNPFFAVQRWNLDPLRYFLMRNGSFKGDMSYANDFIIVAYEKELQANIGNLFNRISRNKTGRWSTLEATEFAREGKFNDIAGLAAEGPDLLSLESTLETAPEKIRNEMDDINLSGALREVFELLRDTNRFISDTAPWQMVKDTSPDARVRLNWVIYRCAEALRIAGIMLQPVMPTKAGELLDGLGVKPERRTVEFAAKGADLEYGVAPLQPQKLGDSGKKIDPKPNAWVSLFPPVSGIELPDYEAVTGQAAPTKAGKTKNRLSRVAASLAEEARQTPGN
ncbi:methionyl-tRNA synthetase [Fusarium falciforme]|nr:methionyl-tRNA synthetase [Fusarium falciforme]